MKNEHEKALEAAKVIREYCKSKSCGTDCIFMELKDIWGFRCNLYDVDVPEFWNLSEAERKCNDNERSIRHGNRGTGTADSEEGYLCR